MNADRTSVADILFDTLRAYWQSKRGVTITANDLLAVKDAAKVFATLTGRESTRALPWIPVEAEDSGESADEIDLIQLVSLMAQQEWTPRDLRALAMRHGLFKGWLTDFDSSAGHARFGLLCQSAAGREFPDGVFLVRGEDRTRRYLIRPGVSTTADFSI